MKKAIIGSIVTLVIGGTGFTISQTDVVNNFAKETAMTQQQAQKYVDDAQKNLESFTKIGQEFTADGNSVLGTAAQVDCGTYSYQWETASLTCPDGKDQLQTIGDNEVQLGDCYGALGSDLGSAAKSKIGECINAIDAVNSSYDLPITQSVVESSRVTDLKNSNLYNKSVLQAALDSN